MYKPPRIKIEYIMSEPREFGNLSYDYIKFNRF